MRQQHSLGLSSAGRPGTWGRTALTGGKLPGCTTWLGRPSAWSTRTEPLPAGNRYEIPPLTPPSVHGTLTEKSIPSETAAVRTGPPADPQPVPE